MKIENENSIGANKKTTLVCTFVALIGLLFSFVLPAARAETPKLAATVDFYCANTESTEEPLPLTEGQVVTKKQGWGVAITSHQAVYAYVFLRNQEDDWQCLLPSEELGGQEANLLEPNEDNWIPFLPEGPTVFLTTDSGKQEIFVYLSQERDPEMDDLASELTFATQGRPKGNIENIIGEPLIDPTGIDWYSRISFVVE